MSGPHDGEVAAVQGGDLDDAQPFGDGDHGGVDRAEGQVGVLGHERGGSCVVSSLEIDDAQTSAAQRGQKRCLGLGALPGGQELADLYDNPAPGRASGPDD